MSQDWNIRNRGTTCKASEQPFEDGIEVYSRLVFGDDGYVREDYSRDAWNDALKAGAISAACRRSWRWSVMRNTRACADPSASPRRRPVVRAASRGSLACD